MARARFRGVFTIPVTPFHGDGAIDFDSLRRCVEFCIECGAHGLVLPVNASEFYTLSDSERLRVIEAGVEASDGELPVVAGVTGVSPQHAVEIALASQEAGADALMALPPGLRTPSPPAMEEYYRALGEAVDLPVFLQNHDPPAGTRIPLDVTVRLLSEVETIRYVKEETMPPGQAMTALLEAAGDACEGVMGGMGGRYLLDEYRRGACGTMPGCHVTDVHVALWNALEGGDEAGAAAIYGRMAPLLIFESAFGVGVYKEVLHRRGVIASATMRVPGRRSLDRYDIEELDRLLAGIDDLLTWRG